MREERKVLGWSSHGDGTDHDESYLSGPAQAQKQDLKLLGEGRNISKHVSESQTPQSDDDSHFVV